MSKFSTILLTISFETLIRMKMMECFYPPLYGEMVMKTEWAYWCSVQRQWKSLADANLRRMVRFRNVFTDGLIQNEFFSICQQCIGIHSKMFSRINFHSSLRVFSFQLYNLLSISLVKINCTGNVYFVLYYLRFLLIFKWYWRTWSKLKIKRRNFI